MPTNYAETVLDRITANVVSTVEKVRTTAGYSCDLHVEQPNGPTGVRSRDGGCVVVVGSSERETADCPSHFSEWHQRYDLICTRIRPEANTTHISEYLAKVAADVVRAMNVDITRGGLAHDTWIESPETDYIGSEANSGVVTVPVTVHYRTYFNDPHRSAYGT